MCTLLRKVPMSFADFSLKGSGQLDAHGCKIPIGVLFKPYLKWLNFPIQRLGVLPKMLAKNKLTYEMRDKACSYHLQWNTSFCMYCRPMNIGYFCLPVIVKDTICIPVTYMKKIFNNLVHKFSKLCFTLLPKLVFGKFSKKKGI